MRVEGSHPHVPFLDTFRASQRDLGAPDHLGRGDPEKGQSPSRGHLDPKGRACRGHPEFFKQKTPSSKQSGQIFPFCSLLLPPILLIMRQITVVALLIFSFAIPFPAFRNSSSPPPPSLWGFRCSVSKRLFLPHCFPTTTTPTDPSPCCPSAG